MALPIFLTSPPTSTLKSYSTIRQGFSFVSLRFNQSFPSLLSFPTPNYSCRRLRLILGSAAKSHTGPVKKRSSSAGNKKKKKKKTKSGVDDSQALSLSDVDVVDDFTAVADDSHALNLSDIKLVDDFTVLADDSQALNVSNVEIVDDFTVVDDDGPSGSSSSLPYHPTPLPKPPAGFVVDEHGKVLLASTKRIVTIVDPANNSPLECVIRRVFRSSQGDECMLLCPVDTPFLVLRSTNVEGWSAVSDEEVKSIIPAAAYALAKIHMHLVHSGFCYTARGGFCYSEEDIFEFETDDGKEVDGVPTEGVEITCFNLEGAHYMIYTPSDPLLFVAVRDENGMLQMADDELLEDPAIISAIDEETEFNALVEEEAALLDSLVGKR